MDGFILRLKAVKQKGAGSLHDLDLQPRAGRWA